MANLAQESLGNMDDREGPLALVVADDDELRESMREVLRELGYAATPRTFYSATRETLHETLREPYAESFALALLCIGRGLPATMRAVAELLASPALVGAEVLLGVTAGVKEMPPLPAAGCAASVVFLRMPFNLDGLAYLARERVTVSHRGPVLRPVSATWDGAIDQPRPAASCESYETYKWVLLMDPSFQRDLARLRDEHVAKAC